VIWRRQQKADHPALALILLTAMIGAGSFVFHTVATRGVVLLDVIPIVIFIYGFFLLALRRFFGLGVQASVAITILFAAGSHSIDSFIHGLNGSVAYLPALGAMVSFAALLWIGPGSMAMAELQRRRTGRGLAMAALLFALSMCFRTIDRDVCYAFPLGTHFLWHVLNAVVLWLLLRTAILANTTSVMECEGRLRQISWRFRVEALI